jgi:OOP family OmpA-OmpF porin
MTLRIVASLTAVLFLSACASLPDPKTCAMIGAGAGAAGGTAGAVVYADHHDDGRAVGIGLGSMVGGALLGYAACALFAEEPAPAPKPAPAPPPPAPKAEPAPDPCTGVIRLRGVEFEFDSATLTPVSSVVLDAAADSLNQCPNIAVGVEGHTDSIGAEAYNQSLGQRRADSVKDYLAGKGVSAARLTTSSYGESRPIASNDTDEGRALNRRVELHPAQ